MEYKLTERLRCNYNGRDFGGPAPTGMVLPSAIMLEAAAEIERLAEEVETLKAELNCAVKVIINAAVASARHETLGRDLILENAKLRHSLTRARAEGMAEAVKVIEFMDIQSRKGEVVTAESLISAIRAKAAE